MQKMFFSSGETMEKEEEQNTVFKVPIQRSLV